MESYIKNTLTYVWFVLTAVTVLSWWLGRGQGLEYELNTGVTVGVLAIAAIKSRLVISYFMEVKTAPTWLKRSCDAWLLILFALLLAMYFYSL